jgi:phosphoglycerol transferase MdoB-like AlkP superfamily enzyme
LERNPYWDHCLTVKRFLRKNPLPSHVSLISILKLMAHTTSYFSGDESSFDRKINFLEYNKIDNVVDINNFGKATLKRKKTPVVFLGDILMQKYSEKTLADLDEKTTRLDIIMTLTNHEPFDFRQKCLFEKSGPYYRFK